MTVHRNTTRRQVVFASCGLTWGVGLCGAGVCMMVLINLKTALLSFLCLDQPMWWKERSSPA